MRALITRPREDATAIAERLEELGIEPLIEPLMTVEPVADSGVDLDGVQAILLTSRNGVRALAAATERRDVAVYAVGDSTAELARECGFVKVDSAGGDSGSLARLVRKHLEPKDGPLLHAAGAAVAGDLSATLAGDGFEIRHRALYETRPIAALSVTTCGLLSDGAVDLVLLFSPRTAQTFVGLVTQAGLAEACSRMTAICLSRAVARSVGALRWREVHVAERPNLTSMIEVAASADAGEAAGKVTERAAPRSDADDDAPGPPRPPSWGSTATQEIPQAWGVGAARPKRRAGVWAAVGAVIAVLAGAGFYAWPWLAAPAGQPAGAAVAADGASARVVRAMAGRVARLEDEVKSLRAGPLARLEASSGAAAVELPRLSERLDAAEQALAAAAGRRDTAAVEARIDARIDALDDTVADLRTVLEARVEGLQTRISGLASGAAEGLTGNARLRAENDRLKAHLTAMSSRVEALEATAARPAPVAGAARGGGLVLAVGQLREALGTAAPFPGALDALKAVGGDDPVVARALAVLAPLAATGVATEHRLIAVFDAAAGAAVRAALAPAGSGWIDRTVQRLASVVTIRRVGADVEGASAQAVLARAEALLLAGDLAGADEALGGLTAEPASAMAAWRESAASRIAADGVLDRLNRHAITLLGAK